jgi:tight adherence protein C
VVERSADPESDVIEELGLVLEELKLGSTRRYALEQLARRAPCDEVRDLVAAAVQSEEQGTPLRVVLGTQATTSRQRRSTRAEETASKASTAMVLPLVLLFVALIVLMIGPVAFDALRSQNSLGGI